MSWNVWDILKLKYLLFLWNSNLTVSCILSGSPSQFFEHGCTCLFITWKRKRNDDYHLDFLRTYYVPIYFESCCSGHALPSVRWPAVPSIATRCRSLPMVPGWRQCHQARAAHSSQRGGIAQTMRGAALARAGAAVGTKDALLTRVR